MNEAITIKDIKIGQVFETSWGYDQTNYDYIVVVDISPSRKTAICQLAQYKQVGYTGQAHIQKPLPIGYGVKFRLRIEYPNNEHSYSNEIGLRGSYPYCALEVARGELNPSKRLGSFSPVKENDVFYETDSQFGH